MEALMKEFNRLSICNQYYPMETPADISKLKSILDRDIRSLAKGDEPLAIIPKDISSIKHGTINDPVLCQVLTVVNSAQSSTRQSDGDLGAFPRMLFLKLTDGRTKFNAVELEELSQLSLNTQRGSKILLKPGTSIWKGTVSLTPQSFIYCGGYVKDLVRNWKEKQEFLRLKELAAYSNSKFSNNSRRVESTDSPPPFMEFKSYRAGSEKNSGVHKTANSASTKQHKLAMEEAGSENLEKKPKHSPGSKSTKSTRLRGRGGSRSNKHSARSNRGRGGRNTVRSTRRNIKNHENPS